MVLWGKTFFQEKKAKLFYIFLKAGNDERKDTSCKVFKVDKRFSNFGNLLANKSQLILPRGFASTNLRLK
jgi:hypothetical protein